MFIISYRFYDCVKFSQNAFIYIFRIFGREPLIILKYTYMTQMYIENMCRAHGNKPGGHCVDKLSSKSLTKDQVSVLIAQNVKNY